MDVLKGVLRQARTRQDKAGQGRTGQDRGGRKRAGLGPADASNGQVLDWPKQTCLCSRDYTVTILRPKRETLVGNVGMPAAVSER